MKKYFALSLLLVAFFSTQLLTSCDDDDYRDSTYSSLGLATLHFQKQDSLYTGPGKLYFRLEGSRQSLYPLNFNLSDTLRDGQRVWIGYNVLPQKVPAYDQVIQVMFFDTVWTSTARLRQPTDSTLGKDVVKLSSASLTGRYINVYCFLPQIGNLGGDVFLTFLPEGTSTAEGDSVSILQFQYRYHVPLGNTSRPTYSKKMVSFSLPDSYSDKRLQRKTIISYRDMNSTTGKINTIDVARPK